MTPLLLLSTALCVAPRAAAPGAVDPARYPLQAPVLVPEGLADEVLRISLPVEVRSAADPPDGSDLALLDAQGRPLAVAVARGESEAARQGLTLRATEEADTWLIEAPDREIDGLEVDLRGSEWVARAAVDRWDGARWVPVGEPDMLWEHDQGGHTRLSLPPTRGELRLRLTRLHDPHRWMPDVDAVMLAEPHVDPVELTLPVAQAVLEESGWARYTVELGRPLPVRAVRVEATDPVFERGVEVALTGELDEWHSPTAEAVLRRVRLGGAALDQVRVELDDRPADLLVIWVECNGLLPLTVPQVTVELEGAELLVPAPGPGPLSLLAGADAGTTPTGDLTVALPELSRLARGPLAPGPVQANAAWTPPEVRAGLVEPSTLLDLAGMTWAHEVQGPPGLVRLPLPPEVLADARVDLSDLRLVDSQGRQVPYLLRRRPLDRDLGDLPFTREEDGAQSRLRIPLPTAGEHDDGPPIATVRLRTQAPLFERTVTLSRVRGPVLEPLRVFRWSGEDRPTTLALDVGMPVGDTLVLTIDNGDDPPLPVEAVSASVEHWELVSFLPESGARLVYGDADRQAPDYDLDLLRQDLVARVGQEATLAPRSSLQVAPATAVEKALVLAGLAALVGGLAVLVVGLVRAVPDEAPVPDA